MKSLSRFVLFLLVASFVAQCAPDKAPEAEVPTAEAETGGGGGGGGMADLAVDGKA